MEHDETRDGALHNSEQEAASTAPGPANVDHGNDYGNRARLQSPAPQAHRTAAQVVLLAAFGLDLLLYSLVVPFLPEEAQRLGATPLATGILFAMYAVGLFAATPLAAWLTDHIGPRRTLLWGLLALAASTLLFAFSPALALNLPGLFVARGAQGVASSLTWTAGLAIVAQLYNPDERSRIFARAFTVTGLAALIGPPLGGVLYTVGGFLLPFLVATGLVLLDGLGRLLFLPGNAVLPATHPEQGATGTLLRDGSFRLGLFAAAAGALALSALEPVTPVLLGGAFGMSSWGIGVVFGGLAFCFVLAQPLVSRTERRIGVRQTAQVGLIVVALSFLGIAFVATRAQDDLLTGAVSIGGMHNVAIRLILVLILLAFIGCALAFVLIPAPELLTQRGQRLAGPNGAAYGAIYAAYNAAYGLGILLGPLATGSAVSLRGVGGSFLLLALAPALSVLALLLWRAFPRLSPSDGEDGMAPQNSDGGGDGDGADLESALKSPQAK